MENILPRAVPVSRGPAARLADRAHDVSRAALAALHRTWQRWQMARLRAAQFQALRRLSPSVLRDIGAAPEWQHAAQHWRDQQAIERDVFLRGL